MGFKSFAYGHSYTGNALGCAAALASLEIFRTERTIDALPPKIETLRSGLEAILQVNGVTEARSCGMIGAIDFADDSGYAAQVCQVARGRGLLTRHIRDTVTLMPPLIVSISELQRALEILNEAVQIVVNRTKQPSGIVGVTA